MMDSSILWGAAFSMATSILKGLGLPERFAFLVNVVAAGIYFGALVSQGSTTKAAAAATAITLIASYGTYKLISKPVREIVTGSMKEEKKP